MVGYLSNNLIAFHDFFLGGGEGGRGGGGGRYLFRLLVGETHSLNKVSFQEQNA